MAPPSIGLGEESVGENEEAIIQEIVGMNIDMLKDEGSPTQRAQHPKHHGCVDATFTVLPNIPDDLQRGVFTDPDTIHKALIRFSSGGKMDDTDSDAHGMAIKLLNVPGPKLQPGEAGSTTHDFVLMDHPVFFSVDLDEYRMFNKHFGEILDAKRNEESVLRRVASAIGNLTSLAVKDIALVLRARAFASQTPSSPLATHYWSTTPYRLGGKAVKYMAETARADEAGAQEAVKDENGLAAALLKDLRKGPATFTFGVHVQTDPIGQPVEDATKPWWPEDDEGGRKSLVPLARIEIPQNAESSENLAEHLVFSPWNVLDAHRPLGIINRIRREVYRRLAEERHSRNKPEGFPKMGSAEVPENLG